MTWIPMTPQIFNFRIWGSLGCHIGLFAISREYQPGKLLILYSYAHHVSDDMEIDLLNC